MPAAPRTPDGSPRGRRVATSLQVTPWSVVRAVLIVAATVLASELILAAATPLWWLAISVVIAAVLVPVALFLDRWLPSWLSVTLVVLVLLAVVGFVGYRGVTEVSNQVTQLADAAKSAAADLQRSERFGTVATQFELSPRVSSFFENLPAGLGGGNASATVSAVASSGGGLVAIGFLTLLLMVFGRRFVTAGLRQVQSASRREAIGAVAGAAYARTTRYLLLMLARATVVGVVTTVALSALGVPAPTALGMWMAAASFIPGIGIAIGSLLVAMVAVLASPVAAVLTVPVALVVQVLDVLFVQAEVERRSVHLGPTATWIAAFVGASLYGLGGAMVGLWTAIFVFALLREMRPGNDDLPDAVEAVVGAVG